MKHLPLVFFLLISFLSRAQFSVGPSGTYYSCWISHLSSSNAVIPLTSSNQSGYTLGAECKIDLSGYVYLTTGVQYAVFNYEFGGNYASNSIFSRFDYNTNQKCLRMPLLFYMKLLKEDFSISLGIGCMFDIDIRDTTLYNKYFYNGAVDSKGNRLTLMNNPNIFLTGGINFEYKPGIIGYRLSLLYAALINGSDDLFTGTHSGFTGYLNQYGAQFSVLYYFDERYKIDHKPTEYKF